MNEQRGQAGGPPSPGAVGQVHLAVEETMPADRELAAAGDIPDETAEEFEAEAERRRWSRQAILIGAVALIASIAALLVILQGVFQLAPD